MAALVRSLGLITSSRNVLKFGGALMQQRRTGYIVLLPEIPDDTAETNSLLKASSIPDYSGVNGEKAFNAVGKLMIEYESGLRQLEEKLQDKDYPKTVDSVLGPIEKLTVPMDSAWSALGNLCLVRNEPDITKAYSLLEPRVRKARGRRFHSPEIFMAVRELYKDIDKFQGDQRQLIEKYYLGSKYMGLELDKKGKNVLKSIQTKVQHQSTIFDDKLNQATNAFKHRIDSDTAKHFPEHLLWHYETASGYITTLHEPQFSIFMANCGDRIQRWNLYNAKTIRASFTNTAWNNSIQIEEIRNCRHQQALTLGFKNYAEYSIKYKMAPTLPDVLNTLMSLSKALEPACAEQLSNLSKFCAEKGFKAQLEKWDIPYWRRRQKESMFSIPESDMKQLFPVDAVLEGLGKLFLKLFGVCLQEVPSSGLLWSPEVKMYTVSLAEDGNKMGTIIVDLQRRVDKYPGSYCQVLKHRSSYAGTEPVVSVVMNINDRTFLSLTELGDLLKKFGHALQHTLSKAKYSEVTGLANLQWDNSTMCPELFDMMLLEERFARLLSANEELPSDYHQKIVESKLQLSAVDLQQEVYLSMLDLELHTSTDYWQEIVKKIQPTIVTSFPFAQHDVYHVCSFAEIITGNMAAGYYSGVWSKMIAADVFKIITKEKDDAAVQRVGKRFRDEFLLEGGCTPSTKAFRKFKGLDPSPDSLITLMSIKK